MKWSNQDKDTVFTLLEQGKTYKEIGKELSRTARAVRLMANKNGKKFSDYLESVWEEIVCPQCSKTFQDYKRFNRKYCSHSCSATHNNLSQAGASAKHSAKVTCKWCKQPLKKTNRTYCSKLCSGAYRSHEAINSGKATGGTLRRHLLATQENICNTCQLASWNDQPIPLDVDHVDGDPYNNDLSNLRLLCKNCHAQTPTYGNKNKGNGRKERYIKYIPKEE